jgi:hypothetical protein
MKTGQTKVSRKVSDWFKCTSQEVYSSTTYSDSFTMTSFQSQGRVGRMGFWRSAGSFELRPGDQGR